MPRFSYTARDRTGATSSATLKPDPQGGPAPARRTRIVARAHRRGIGSGARESVPPDQAIAPGAEQQMKLPPAARRRPSAQAPGRRERLPFLTALEDLTSSGLSAGEAVRLLSIRVKEPRLRALSAGLWERIGEGASLSAAMTGYPDVFEASSINLIQAGEATGSLNDVLKRLISHLTEQRELQRQLASALAYPIFMMVVAGGVILFFLFFLLPRLQTLLSSLGGELPTSTAILVGISDFALRYGVILVVAAVFGVIASWRWYKTEPGRASTDALLLRVPFTAPFAVSQTVLAISQTLSVLLENGITTAGGHWAGPPARSRTACTGGPLEGRHQSHPRGRIPLDRMGPHPVFSRPRARSAGRRREDPGDFVPALKKVAASYQARITQQLNLATRVIASTVLLGVFTFVGFIAFAIVSAVFQLSASFNR